MACLYIQEKYRQSAKHPQTSTGDVDPRGCDKSSSMIISGHDDHVVFGNRPCEVTMTTSFCTLTFTCFIHILGIKYMCIIPQ